MQRSKHKPKSSRPWSEPKWHDQYQQWYLERKDRHGTSIHATWVSVYLVLTRHPPGTIQYNWIGPTLPNAPDQSIPRSEHAIDNLAEGVQNLSVDQGAYETTPSFEYASHHTTTVDHDSYTLDARMPQEPNYMGHVQAQQHNNKGKGKAVIVEQREEYNNSSVSGNPPRTENELPRVVHGYSQEPHPQCEIFSIAK